MARRSRWKGRGGLLATLALILLGGMLTTASGGAALADDFHPGSTLTPIQHLVVIYQENISFDHYFGTYPNAANTDGTPFHATPGTPRVNGLTPELLNNNPNAFNPQRLSPSQALTCDQDHGYGAEQKAYDGGKMDKFVEFTETDKCTGQPILFGAPGLVMDYYDGNTVTGLWNYAQHYAMSDNSFDTTFGPSTPGVLNLVAGQTHGAFAVDPETGERLPTSTAVRSPDAYGIGTVIGDPDPALDDCSDKNHTASGDLVGMTGKNVGDLLNAEGVTWGWFQGGFRPTGAQNGFSVCGGAHDNIGGNSVTDYVPHHEPFEYYRSTANPKHVAPSSPAMIGKTDPANHQYDLADFHTALQTGHMPAVSFLKPPAYQNGHPGNSDPLDEQRFLVSSINELQKSPEWKSTAVVVAYDDSDGWYDHVASPIINGSDDSSQDTAMCSVMPAAGHQQDRCGFGPRQPLLAISPYSRVNAVDHTATAQASILDFIERNWHTGRIGDSSYDTRAASLLGLFDFASRPHTTPVLLDPKTGAITSGQR
jgi:phospholipase C